MTPSAGVDVASLSLASGPVFSKGVFFPSFSFFSFFSPPLSRGESGDSFARLAPLFGWRESGRDESRADVQGASSSRETSTRTRGISPATRRTQRERPAHPTPSPSPPTITDTRVLGCQEKMNRKHSSLLSSPPLLNTPRQPLSFPRAFFARKETSASPDDEHCRIGAHLSSIPGPRL